MARFLGFILFFLLLSLASSTYISDTIFEPHRSTGRSLLQNKKNCPVNFENQNYTIITSKCKGPKYTADLCCGAFKEFACPFAEQINDMSTNCADTMFSYINLYGKYPPGIFANLCKGDKYGLACDDVKSENMESKDSKTNGAHIGNVLSPMVAVLAGSLVFLVFLL